MDLDTARNTLEAMAIADKITDELLEATAVVLEALEKVTPPQIQPQDPWDSSIRRHITELNQNAFTDGGMCPPYPSANLNEILRELEGDDV